MARISSCALNVALANFWSQSMLNISPWTRPGMRAARVLTAAPWQISCFLRCIKHNSWPHRPLDACRAMSIERHAPRVEGERADSILRYWLGDSYLTDPVQHIEPQKQKIWFSGDADIDQEIKSRFGSDVEAAAAGKLASWQHGYDALALIILGDQFTRNVYRGTPKMFSQDQETLALAKRLIESGEQEDIKLAHRLWLYMPFTHSEELQDQEVGVELFVRMLSQTEALPGGGQPLSTAVQSHLDFARAHRDVISKWGRFPHRNKILGRQSTEEEEHGMKDKTIPSF